ncbi:hypothetical protein D0N36_18925, partial [Hymenobacter lapidiphilus]|uniref:hypothetical protein n=1 Tax=Hymenobacter sp. CCM 8763 TaxID=2303334 RepID=UPI000E9D9EBE
QQLQAQQMKVGQEQERLQGQAQQEQAKLNDQVMGRVNKQIEKAAGGDKPRTLHRSTRNCSYAPTRRSSSTIGSSW